VIRVFFDLSRLNSGELSGVGIWRVSYLALGFGEPPISIEKLGESENHL